MKKSIVLAAVVLGSFSTFATTTLPISNLIAKIAVIGEEFKEIKIEEVPDAVKVALKTVQPDAVLDKAFVNEKKEYKLEITVKDQKATVYSDAAGNLIHK